jgi:mannose-6-phosphate isomerase-like protein (cupin superfamily)
MPGVHSVAISDAPDTIAPDGSLIGLLAAGERGSMVHCTLPPAAVTRAVHHRSVEEVWLVLAGTGVLALGDERLSLRRGVSVVIPPRTSFQFRAGWRGLELVIVTMPPWPGGDEAQSTTGPWIPVVD